MNGTLVDRIRHRLVMDGVSPTASTVADALRSEQQVLGSGALLALVDRLRSEMLGAGPLDALLALPGITDVLVNGPDQVLIDRGHGLEPTEVRFESDDVVRRLAQRMAAVAGRRLDKSKPYNRPMTKAWNNGKSVKQAPESVRACIYARISSDPSAKAHGVARQEQDCRALAERNGWKVAAVFVDNDLSASTSSSKPREQYVEMLRLARQGSYDVLIAYSNSRLTRRPREFEDLIELAERYRVRIVTVVSGEDNLATADGRQNARIKASIDAAEAERTAERVRRAKDQAAAQGKYRGGPRPYGYTKSGTRVKESEAKVVRAATEAVLAGRSLAAVAKELNAQGQKTSTGKDWTYARLKDVLTRPRNAGLLSTGRFDRGTGKIEGKAEWRAIVDEDSWRRVHTMLTDPSRRMNAGNVVKWLGAGIYRCGLCGGALRPAPTGGTKSRPEGRKYLYRCVESAHLTISAHQTDEHVLEVVAALVSKPEIVAAMHPADPNLEDRHEERTRLSRRLENFETDYALGRITGAQLHKATTAVSAELAAVQAKITESLRRSTSSPVLGAPDPGAAFLAAPVDIQRAVLSAAVTVQVVSSTRRGGTWASDRIRFTPAGGSTPHRVDTCQVDGTQNP